MGKELVKFLANINICFVSLASVIFILSLLFLFKKKVNSFLKKIFIIIYVILSWVCFYFFNDTFNRIFSMKYFNIKTYLLLLIVVNIITIVNINFVKKMVYKVLNYIMFAINSIIFLLNVFVFLGSEFSVFKISLDDLSKFMNINFIIFLVYLNILGVICFIDMLFIKYKNHKKNNKIVDKVVYDKLEVDDVEASDLETDGKEVATVKKEIPSNNTNVISNNGSFIIDGIDCSAVFDGSSHDEIMKNYYILLNDVNAKLINGYTIHEYTKIKSIIDKLNIKDLNKIKLDINKLSMITYDEYNLLKNYLNSKNIKI